MSQGGAGVLLFAGVSLLIAACGGSALRDGDPGSAGQSNSGGSSSSAGATSMAGQGQGGSSVAGAQATDRCSLPAVPGMCDAYFPAFFHDANSGLCEPFVYGGCGGNDNRFDTRAACIAACPGGGSDWGACKVDSDCALTGASCCQACDPAQDHDLLAINASHLSDQANAHCASVGACAPCQSVPESMATLKYFRPVCAAGQCSALDVRDSPFTQCEQDSDCTLRDGVKCCPECDGGFVSVNSSANFCPDGPEPCGKCAPIPPKSQVPLCRAGRCISEETLR